MDNNINESVVRRISTVIPTIRFVELLADPAWLFTKTSDAASILGSVVLLHVLLALFTTMSFSVAFRTALLVKMPLFCCLLLPK